MLKQTIRYVVIAIVLSLTGCGEPTLDTKNADTFEASFQEIIADLPQEERIEVVRAIGAMYEEARNPEFLPRNIILKEMEEAFLIPEFRRMVLGDILSETGDKLHGKTRGALLEEYAAIKKRGEINLLKAKKREEKNLLKKLVDKYNDKMQALSKTSKWISGAKKNREELETRIGWTIKQLKATRAKLTRLELSVSELSTSVAYTVEVPNIFDKKIRELRISFSHTFKGNTLMYEIIDLSVTSGLPKTGLEPGETAIYSSDEGLVHIGSVNGVKSPEDSKITTEVTRIILEDGTELSGNKPDELKWAIKRLDDEIAYKKRAMPDQKKQLQDLKTEIQKQAEKLGEEIKLPDLPKD